MTRYGSVNGSQISGRSITLPIGSQATQPSSIDTRTPNAARPHTNAGFTRQGNWRALTQSSGKTSPVYPKARSLDPSSECRDQTNAPAHMFSSSSSSNMVVKHASPSSPSSGATRIGHVNHGISCSQRNTDTKSALPIPKVIPFQRFANTDQTFPVHVHGPMCKRDHDRALHISCAHHDTTQYPGIAGNESFDQDLQKSHRNDQRSSQLNARCKDASLTEPHCSNLGIDPRFCSPKPEVTNVCLPRAQSHIVFSLGAKADLAFPVHARSVSPMRERSEQNSVQTQRTSCSPKNNSDGVAQISYLHHDISQSPDQRSSQLNPPCKDISQSEQYCPKPDETKILCQSQPGSVLVRRHIPLCANTDQAFLVQAHFTSPVRECREQKSVHERDCSPKRNNDRATQNSCAHHDISQSLGISGNEGFDQDSQKSHGKDQRSSQLNPRCKDLSELEQYIPKPDETNILCQRTQSGSVLVSGRDCTQKKESDGVPQRGHVPIQICANTNQPFLVYARCISPVRECREQNCVLARDSSPKKNCDGAAQISWAQHDTLQYPVISGDESFDQDSRKNHRKDQRSSQLNPRCKDLSEPDQYIPKLDETNALRQRTQSGSGVPFQLCANTNQQFPFYARCISPVPGCREQNCVHALVRTPTIGPGRECRELTNGSATILGPKIHSDVASQISWARYDISQSARADNENLDEDSRKSLRTVRQKDIEVSGLDAQQVAISKDAASNNSVVDLYSHCKKHSEKELQTSLNSDNERKASVSSILSSPKLSDRIQAHSNSFKLAVFDFDCTLTCFHVFSSLAGTGSTRFTLGVAPPYARTERGQLSRLCELETDPNWGPRAFVLKAFGGESRVSRLRQVLEALRNADVQCFILSRGMVGPIAKCLEQVELLPFFSRIVANIGSAVGSTDYDSNLPPDACEAEGHLMGNANVDIAGMGNSKSESIKKFMEESQFTFQQVVFIDDELDMIREAQSTCRCLHVVGNGVHEQEFQCLQEMINEGSRHQAALGKRSIQQSDAPPPMPFPCIPRPFTSQSFSAPVRATSPLPMQSSPCKSRPFTSQSFSAPVRATSPQPRRSSYPLPDSTSSQNQCGSVLRGMPWQSQGRMRQHAISL